MTTTVEAVLRDPLRAWQRWARDEALPLWRRTGFDDDLGLFYERLHLDGRPDLAAGSRLRTQARQIYVYAHAHRMGLDPEGLATARRALLTLRAKAWGPDGRAGWVHRLDAMGGVEDATRDLYDHAFVLLMLAHYLHASGESFVRPWIDQTLAEIDDVFRAEHGGLAETAAGGLPRRQNPHMHLFEAMHALYEATGAARFLARAGELFQLFRTRFYDDGHGVVREFFAGDWSHLPDGSSDRVEPGHLAEWTWLLRRHERLAHRPVGDLAPRLLLNALRLGTAPERPHLLADETDLDGRPRSDSRRLWCQTELIKALVVEARASGDVALAERAAAVSATLFREYLSDTPAGTWRDRFTLDGRLVVDHVPASTFYHLFGVLTELARGPTPATP